MKHFLLTICLLLSAAATANAQCPFPFTSPPSALPVQLVCGGGTLVDLWITGSNIKWYNEPALTNELPLTTPLENGKTYYAVQTSGDCISDYRAVTAYTQPTVNQPFSQNYCNNMNILETNFSGTPNTTFHWTNDNTAIGLPASGTGNLPPFTTTNTTNAIITGSIKVTPTSDWCVIGTPVYFDIAKATYVPP